MYVFKNFTEINESESLEIFMGRNDEHVRRWMKSDSMLKFSEHQCFIESLRDQSDRLYFRVERSGRFVGVYSIVDLCNGEGIGGFWITSYARDRLLGLNVVFHSIDYLFKSRPLHCIRGYQLFDNLAAKKINALLGFLPVASPKKSDPRMNYLELSRLEWEKNGPRKNKLLKIIELAENRNEN